MVQSASRSEPEPAAVIPTFLPLRSLTSSVDFTGTISCQPKLPIAALATILLITPFLRPAETSEGGSRMMSAAPAARPSKVSAPERKIVSSAVMPSFSNSFCRTAVSAIVVGQ